jgi:hypothetical protein
VDRAIAWRGNGLSEKGLGVQGVAVTQDGKIEFVTSLLRVSVYTLLLLFTFMCYCIVTVA